MNYNIHISTFMGTYNILVINEDKMRKVVDAYLNGEKNVTLSGQLYNFGRGLRTFRVFESNPEFSFHQLKQINDSTGVIRNIDRSRYFDPNQLLQYGKEVTDEIVGDRAFGSQKENPIADNENFINAARIEALKTLNGKCRYDLSKLISLCTEINDNYVRHNYYSVALLLRTLLNHVPSAFGGKESFDQVLAELNGSKHKTRKEILSRLHELQRKFADLVTHERLREFEPQMTLQQVSFIPEIDYLLQEVTTELKKLI